LSFCIVPVLTSACLLYAPAAADDTPVPSGLVVVIENRPLVKGPMELRALPNPSISGVAFLKLLSTPFRKFFQAYAESFPKQTVSLSAGTSLNIKDQGRIVLRERFRTRQTIVDEGIRHLGRRFAPQLSDVHAGLGVHNLTSEPGDQFVIDYIGRIITGFQMRASAMRARAVMGADGDLRGRAIYTVGL